ncbi:MAG: AsmA family protein [Mangrovibacterium sp.]
MNKETKVRLKKKYIILLIVLVIIVLVFILLPGIARSYLVQHGEELTGRKINLEKLKVNYFQVSVTARNFDMYEQNKEDIFVHFDELYINFNPWRLLQQEYKFSEIRLAKPSVSLLYSGSGFNFSDFMTSSDTTEVDAGSDEPVRYVVQNLNISDGYIRYEDETVQSVSELKSLSLKIPEIAWDNSNSELGADFILGENGKVLVGGNIDQAAGRYTPLT